MLEDFTDEHVMAETRKLLVPYRLKRTLRYNATRDHSIHNESVAEHVFALTYLAQYFLPLEDPERFMDWERINRILLFHDFGEIIHGDVPYHLKTAEHEAREREAATQVFASLPKPLGCLGRESWSDYEQRGSPEARFAYALDKLEPVFELHDAVNERSLVRLKHTFEDHIGKKRRAMEHVFPIMWRFVEVLSADMLTRGIFWVPQEDDAA